MLWINGRGEGHRELAAIHASWLMNCWVEKGHHVTAGDLLGKPKNVVSAKDFDSVETYQEYLREKGKE